MNLFLLPLLLALLPPLTLAYIPTIATRRAFISTSFTVATLSPLLPAHASGGATAGGAYLLSAKQVRVQCIFPGKRLHI